MTPEHLVVPKSKEVSQINTHTHSYGAVSKGHRGQLEEFPVAKAGTV